MTRVRFWQLLAILCYCAPVTVYAYAYVGQVGGSQVPPQSNQFFGDPVIWSNPQVAMTLDFEPQFNDSAKTAMDEWNAVGTAFHFHIGSTAAQPCDNDGVNAAGWRQLTCGNQQFGDALAVTLRNFRFNTGTGLWEMKDADIIVDQSQPWIPRISGSLNSAQDFYRVVLHELGHVLGLEHPDEAGQSTDAIMNSSVSDLVTLQNDDIRGINFLYGSNTGGSSSNTAPVTSSNSRGGASMALTLMLLLYWLQRYFRSLLTRNEVRQ